MQFIGHRDEGLRKVEPMMEVEAKIRVADLEPIRQRLQELGCPCQEEREERDVYYNLNERDFGVTDEALRIRQSGGEFTLTYKGPKLPEYHFKAREELTVCMDSGPTMELILERLGLRRVREVVKRREVYRLGGTTVSLDLVEGLGSFVEIEAVTDVGETNAEGAIEQVKRMLGVEGESTTLSYLELLLARR